MVPLYTGSPYFPSLMNVTWSSPRQYFVGLCYSRGAPSLGNPNFVSYCQQNSPAFDLEGAGIFISLVRKQIFPPPCCETLSLSSKIQAPSQGNQEQTRSQESQKHLGQSLPTIVVMAVAMVVA